MRMLSQSPAMHTRSGVARETSLLWKMLVLSARLKHNLDKRNDRVCKMCAGLSGDAERRGPHSTPGVTQDL